MTQAKGYRSGLTWTLWTGRVSPGLCGPVRVSPGLCGPVWTHLDSVDRSESHLDSVDRSSLLVSLSASRSDGTGSDWFNLSLSLSLSLSQVSLSASRSDGTGSDWFNLSLSLSLSLSQVSLLASRSDGAGSLSRPLALMGQGQTVGRLPDKVLRHAALVKDSGYLTYDEFLARVSELNDVTAKLASGQQKHLLFEVEPGSDASALWKVAVRVVCTKINKETGTVEASRIMNLYQFIQLYKDITSQAAELTAEGAEEELTAGGAAEELTGGGATGDISSSSTCQASVWMGRVKELTDEEECCICMDGKADLILPCAHIFCQKCIDKWSGQQRNCPVCRLQVSAANDSWVVSDFPSDHELAGYILNLADEAGHPHRP
ncbi:hypothetical protein WMY93_023161 [Mugilogobius chulae]|uniref:RING finger protein 141 n=1 Tax=Mugilogobius chulae TaxID=88201 RepID=A0AAW0N8F7_9GOBI